MGKILTGVTSSKSYILISVIILKALIDYSYVNYVVPNFSYSGFHLIENDVKYILSYGGVVLFALFLPSTINTPAQLIIHLFYLSVILPVLSYYGLADQPTWVTVCIVTQFVIVVLFSKVLSGSTKRLKIRYLRNGTKYALLVSQILVLFIFAFVVVTGGSAINFDLSLVYEFREDANKMFGGPLLSYVVNWVVKVFNIVLIVWYLLKMNYLKAAVFIVIQIILFGYLTQKSVLFSPLILIFTYILFEKVNRRVMFLYLSFIGSLFLVMLKYHFDGDLILGTLIVRRLLFLPVLLNFTYYEFFAQNEFVFLSNGIFSALVDYPYNETTSLVIGRYLNTEMSANTGFVATSYMHFGIFGVFIFPIIVGFVLRILDVVCEPMPPWIGAGITLLPFMSLIQSSDLFTSLLTHGIIVSIIILWLFNDLKKKNI